MKTLAVKLAACGLAAFFLVAPAQLSAKQRQGATLVVIKLDGAQVSGELIAVRPDSLLLLSDSRDLSIPLAEVQIVRIVRRSRVWPYAGIGGAIGLAGMGLLVSSAGPDVEYGTEKTLLVGGVGVLAGVIAGFVKGVDPVFAVAGRPQADIARYWVKLSAHSREGRIKEPLL